MQLVDLRLVLGLKRHHSAIADAHRLTIMRIADANAGRPVRRAPGNEGFGGEHARRIELSRDGIIKFRSAFKVARSNGDIADHDYLPQPAKRT